MSKEAAASLIQSKTVPDFFRKNNPFSFPIARFGAIGGDL
jgi:hypothetical protein